MEEDNIDDPSRRKPIDGKKLTVVVKDEVDLSRTISHTRLTQMMIPTVGLEFESERFEILVFAPFF